MKSLSSILLLTAFNFTSFGQTSKPVPAHQDTIPGQPVTTSHQIQTGKETLIYKTVTGYMPVKDKEEKLIAKIFYIACIAADSKNATKRPLTFVFNGGPGVSSLFLQMGGIGPVRATYADALGNAPAPPYTYAGNPDTWLKFTDLVFIDPISTGFSKPYKGTDAKQFHGFNEDVASVADFIEQYMTLNACWNRPLFLAGESYGGIRAAGLAVYLKDHYAINLNGITLISPVINFQVISEKSGNDLPYIYFLPGYAISAAYHHQLHEELESLPLAELSKKAERFSQGTYAYFLSLGQDAPQHLTDQVVDSLSYFTGLSKTYIRQTNERITSFHFFKELLRTSGKTVGRYDGRFTGEDSNDAGEVAGYDASANNFLSFFKGAFMNYLHNELRYQNEANYEADVFFDYWNFHNTENEYLDLSESLRTAITQNPHLKVMLACGYYDLASPAFGNAYVKSHLGLRPELRGNVTLNYYDSGHMIYVSKAANEKLTHDAAAFYEQKR